MQHLLKEPSCLVTTPRSKDSGRDTALGPVSLCPGLISIAEHGPFCTAEHGVLRGCTMALLSFHVLPAGLPWGTAPSRPWHGHPPSPGQNSLVRGWWGESSSHWSLTSEEFAKETRLNWIRGTCSENQIQIWYCLPLNRFPSSTVHSNIREMSSPPGLVQIWQVSLQLQPHLSLSSFSPHSPFSCI